MLKDDVLKELYESRVVVSGEALAERLGVSRNAVWKCIKQLKKEGFVISASTNKGYFLEACKSALSPVIIQSELDANKLDCELLFFDEINSTNTKAKELAEQGYKNGTVVIARTQTGGRGRLGRKFYSPESGLYLSIIARPVLIDSEASRITSMCAVATAEAIESVCPLKVYIKWVNDLFVNNKKTCGILTEAGLNLENRSIDYVVIGIGINCAKQTFPADLKDIATSLENECGLSVNINSLAVEIIKRVLAGINNIGDASIIKECRKRSILLGKTITVLCGENSYDATATGIDDDGGLVVKLADGQIKTLKSGEVSVRL